VARPVIYVEVIGNQHTIVSHADSPGIADVTVAAVGANDELLRFIEILALRLQQPTADSERLPAITVRQYNATVRHCGSRKRMPQMVEGRLSADPGNRGDIHELEFRHLAQVAGLGLCLHLSQCVIQLQQEGSE